MPQRRSSAAPKTHPQLPQFPHRVLRDRRWLSCQLPLACSHCGSRSVQWGLEPQVLPLTGSVASGRLLNLSVPVSHREAVAVAERC